MLILLIHIFFIAFFFNLLWEVLHSQLYATCIRVPIKIYIYKIIMTSIKDGLWIVLFYLISVIVFDNVTILTNVLQMTFFFFLSLIFAFLDEKISLYKKRWEYTSQMPLFFGVGVTPFVQIAMTGIATFLYIFALISL